MDETKAYDWRSLTPEYVPVLSSSHLVKENRMFHLGAGKVTREGRMPPHIHDCYEVGVVTSGEGVFVVGDREIPFVTGEVYIINDLQPHMHYPSGTSEEVGLYVVHFHPSVITDSWISKLRMESWLPFSWVLNMTGPTFPLDDPVTPLIRGLLAQIDKEAQAKENAWEIVVGGFLIQMTGYLARRLLQNRTGDSYHHAKFEAAQRISPTLRLIEARFPEAIGLDRMAREAALSRSHLSALFKLAFNESPVAYRNTRRIMEGQRLLRTSDLPVHEIANRVGFTSVQEFNRNFLRKIGVQPSLFRADLKQKSED